MKGVAGDAVWTKTAPEGWLIDDSGMPGVGDPNARRRDRMGRLEFCR